MARLLTHGESKQIIQGMQVPYSQVSMHFSKRKESSFSGYRQFAQPSTIMYAKVENMKRKKIVVIGLGGVGGYFGFKISHQNESNKVVDITFVARGETYQIVKERGLTLISTEALNPNTKPDNLIENIADIPETDLVLICVKEYDLESVCNQLKDKINPNTLLLPLMNGVDIYDRITKIINTGIVLPACVYVASHIKQRGIVEHKGNTGKIIFGKDPRYNNYEFEWIIDLLSDSGIDVAYKENSFPDIWTKFFFIASFGLVSARYNKSIGEVNSETILKARAMAIMQEILQIAIKKQIQLPENIIELTFQKAATFPFQTPTSLQLDVQSKKANNELELFAGAIINFGKQLNISVPETHKIYVEIKDLILLK
jgi:2-dehydropantoate 2-reductase